MNFAVVSRIVGVLLIIFSFTHLPPIGVSFWFGNGSELTFLSAFLITFLAGAALWYPARRKRREMRTRDCFLIVTLFWMVLGSIGCLPFLMAPELKLSLTDAVFESMSGLTTTGATVITGLDELPEALLYYRQQLQWLGGLGIVAIAMAILPLLGIGGMQLYKADSASHIKEDKLLPRVAQTARALLLTYVLLTLACALAYRVTGMDLFDAICHSFSTVSIGGFSTHDNNMAWFDSTAIHAVATVFMVISGVNFGLHFTAVSTRSLSHYWKDTEFRFYIGLLITLAIATVIMLGISRTYSAGESWVQGVFQVVSFATTTGFTTTNFETWPAFLPFMLIYMSMIGSCAGSTGGGMKVIRLVLIIKQGARELSRLIHPSAVLPIKIGKEKVSPNIIESVWAFFSVYVMAYVAMMVALLSGGLDITTAFTAVGAAINNLGPGLGQVAHDFTTLGDYAKWVLCFGMLLGRLEVFTLLVLLTPWFWRK